MPRRQTGNPGQLSIFGAPQVPPRPRTEPNGSKAPRWTRYRRVDPLPCDFCKLNQVDDPSAPVARKARYRRVTSERDLYLCTEHANDQRTADKMPQFRARVPFTTRR